MCFLAPIFGLDFKTEKWDQISRPTYSYGEFLVVARLKSEGEACAEGSHWRAVLTMLLLYRLIPSIHACALHLKLRAECFEFVCLALDPCLVKCAAHRETKRRPPKISKQAP